MEMIKKVWTKTTARDKSQRGFSLIEMLVAMVIFLIITSAIYGLLAMGRTSRNRSSRRTDVLKKRADHDPSDWARRA